MAPTSKGSSTRSALIAVSDYKMAVTRDQVSIHGRKRFANDFTSKVNLKLARNIVSPKPSDGCLHCLHWVRLFIYGSILGESFPFIYPIYPIYQSTIVKDRVHSWKAYTSNTMRIHCSRLRQPVGVTTSRIPTRTPVMIEAPRCGLLEKLYPNETDLQCKSDWQLPCVYIMAVPSTAISYTLKVQGKAVKHSVSYLSVGPTQ